LEGEEGRVGHRWFKGKGEGGPQIFHISNIRKSKHPGLLEEGGKGGAPDVAPGKTLGGGKKSQQRTTPKVSGGGKNFWKVPGSNPGTDVTLGREKKYRKFAQGKKG